MKIFNIYTQMRLLSDRGVIIGRIWNEGEKQKGSLLYYLFKSYQ